MRTVLYKICRENQNTHFMLNKLFFFRKSCGLWDNVEKCGGATGVTDGHNMAHTRLVCWMNKATCIYTHTHKYVIQWFANAPKCYVMRTLPVLFSVVCCVVRTVHKSDFRHITNQTPNKWRPLERSFSDRFSALICARWKWGSATRSVCFI